MALGFQMIQIKWDTPSSSQGIFPVPYSCLEAKIAGRPGTHHNPGDGKMASGNHWFCPKCFKAKSEVLPKKPQLLPKKSHASNIFHAASHYHTTLRCCQTWRKFGGFEMGRANYGRHSYSQIWQTVVGCSYRTHPNRHRLEHFYQDVTYYFDYMFSMVFQVIKAELFLSR